ncbi:MAG: tRNA uridine-5-carboxymethylaminomethyl(34) synthesis enzyme MnmG [Oscillospiraceae bacterium]|jgi:tRNA uridine 5-carboxymethylaminomethyl modification enzyme|nr:tRNA uridine-5-carboxymethylaminomethyl(34) synthesis enzyme MnmG [Oscillospiraceae bacterium]
MSFEAGQYDIAVIGAGHAGVEASLAAARLGINTICFAINLDSVANLPCNPNIGGTGKGHLVRELDALGGEMAKCADRACIQFRMLNRGKGPAVHSLRAQADKRKYQDLMKHTLEKQKNLTLRQAEIVDIYKTGDGSLSYDTSQDREPSPVLAVKTHTGAIFRCKAVIVCTGTYLGACTIIGEAIQPGGPDGMFASTALGERLRELGLSFQRFKTGTPARINSRDVDYSKMEAQHGDEPPPTFSFETTEPLIPINKAICHLTYTNEKTHEIIRENLHRSPMHSGKIEGTGARYCPSIEDKIVRFADKKRHQIFLEPMGLDTEEIYLQGFSSSMPEEVQLQMIRSVSGLENAQIMRPAYAIEYDCIDPLELLPTLESKKIPGLYGAGQFCGSSGYEEAAVQGYVAGVNAALKIKGEKPLIISRNDGYIGTLIDDLVTKGTSEPYRMMTSRTEYRLLHRQDNADIRMSHFGNRVGLISNERHERVLEKYRAVEREIARLEETFIPPGDALKKLLESHDSQNAENGISLSALLRRPKISYIDIKTLDENAPNLPTEISQQAEISIKYAGYIKRQERQLSELIRMENHMIPDDIDYDSLNILRTEARQKLSAIRPQNLGQATRISGVSPADAAALMIYLKSL